jgi:signal peptidase II
MKRTAEKTILATGITVMVLDQFTKWIVERSLPLGHEFAILAGFFKFVHWGNTGAAWSLFHGNNHVLAAVSAAALVVLYKVRRYFEADRLSGQLALGLILGGIGGNLVDRVFRRHVVDFLYFHLIRRDGEELGFPAFNVADMAICTGVGIILLLSWLARPDSARRSPGGVGGEASPKRSLQEITSRH